ncbi:MAG TPA: L-threonylcarbamoyladenylate synthase [Nitrososphaeraceae archaeon]|nr:L-threonylcarbamoyladenylate synthase [Nitrososphaeraceae archaeon]
MKKKFRTEIVKLDEKRPNETIVSNASKLIRSGEIVAFPTETVYGLGGNALDPSSVTRIFEIKGRPPDNPLIVHIADMRMLEEIVIQIPPKAHRIIDKFWPGPITLVLKKSKIVPEITTGGLKTVAVRMPKNKIALALIRKSGTPIAAPSANISGRPSPTSAIHVKDDLDGKIKLILDGGSTRIGIESTVIDMTRRIPVILRPGGISKESIENEIGKVCFYDSLLGNDYSNKMIHRSPGMKYQHYSPKAKVILVEGPENHVKTKIIELSKKLEAEGKKVTILTASKSLKVNPKKIQYMGSTLETIARNLFANLRKADKDNIDVIIVQGIQYRKTGIAIMNRLKKAASTKIKVEPKRTKH